MGTREGRRAGHAAAQRATHTQTIADTPDICWQCLVRPSCQGWSLCRQCLVDFRDGLRRRRSASYRLVPLECGRRDPLDLRSAA